MTAPDMPFRRVLIAAALCGGAAWLSKRTPFNAGRVRPLGALTGADALAVLCAELRCPPAIGGACVQALPAPNSEEVLARLILSDTVPSGTTFTSAYTLTRAVRERSRVDFRTGRIVTVDGWILSMTETRLYALATLLSQT
jgi:hypothetical protein